MRESNPPDYLSQSSLPRLATALSSLRLGGKNGALGLLPWHNTIIMVCVFSLPLIYRSITAQLVLIHCSLLFLGVTPKYHAAAKSAFRFLRVYVAADMSSISMVVPSGVSVSGPSQYLILSKR